jgi:hypothetical protein
VQLFGDDAFFRCGKCGNEAPADRKAFKQHDLGGKTWCSHCKKNVFVANWKCRCGMPWHMCKLHREGADALRKEKNRNKEELKKEKKTRTSGEGPNYKKTCVIFTAKERRRVESCEIKLSLLSPSLKRKFGHLCTE